MVFMSVYVIGWTQRVNADSIVETSQCDRCTVLLLNYDAVCSSKAGIASWSLVVCLVIMANRRTKTLAFVMAITYYNQPAAVLNIHVCEVCMCAEVLASQCMILHMSPASSGDLQGCQKALPMGFVGSTQRCSTSSEY
jgi:hypothetical protein